MSKTGRLILVGAVLTLGVPALMAGNPRRSPEKLLIAFSRDWDEQGWTQKSGRRPHGYMRALNDRGWRARMVTLQGLVSHGKSAVPVLVEAVKNGKTPNRILAAQALGYLAPNVPYRALLDAAKNDKDPAVRLYAVDALGMRGSTEGNIDWNELRQSERNSDARKHIEYAIERKNRPAEADVIEDLKGWDSAKIDSAKLGQLAPDFELISATGEKVRLSQFRGKQAVVLVFVYGDT